MRISPEIEILGFEIARPPFARAFLRLPDESTLLALYGLNGAGKTQLLTAIRNCLSGRADTNGTRVFIRLHAPKSGPGGPLSASGAMSVGDLPTASKAAQRPVLVQKLGGLLLKQSEGLWRRGLENYLDELERQPMQSFEVLSDHPSVRYFEDAPASDDLVFEVLSRECEEEPVEVVKSIASQLVFSLEPKGSAEAPLWKTAIGAVLAECDPRVREGYADRLEAGARLADLGVGGWSPDNVKSIVESIPSSFRVTDGLMDGMRHIERPPWAPVSLVEIGLVESDAGLPTFFDESALAGQSVDEAFTARLRRDSRWSGDSGVFEGEGDDLYGPAVWFIETCEDVERLANRILHELISGAPTLKCVHRPPGDWVDGTVVRWTASEQGEIAIEDLSEAQRRWAELSIAVSMTVVARLSQENADQTLTSLIALLDEPERGLHPLAFARLLAGLKHVSTVLNAPVVLATHSAHILSDDGVALVHVSRNQTGSSDLSPLRAGIQREIEALGLSSADVLQQIRVFLLVEGEHDRAVLEAFFPTEMSELGAAILVMRGTGNLVPTVDSQFLFNYTEATVLVVIDAVRIEPVRKIWNEARDAAKTGSLSLARRIVQAFDPKTSEEMQLKLFMMAALERGLAHRLEVHPLSRRDVIEYLEPPASVGLSMSDLKAGWDRSVPFKNWVAAKTGIPVNASTLRSWASQMDSIPVELTELLATCRALTRPV